MGDIFPWCITIGVICTMFGLLLGLNVSSRIYEQYVKRVEARLKVISEVSQEMFDGAHDGNEKSVALFILCESDLNLVDDTRTKPSSDNGKTSDDTTRK